MKIYAQEKHNIPSAAKLGLGQLWVLKFLQLKQFEFFVKACLKTWSEHTLSTSTSTLCFEQSNVDVKFSQFKQDVIDLTSINKFLTNLSLITFRININNC